MVIWYQPLNQMSPLKNSQLFFFPDGRERQVSGLASISQRNVNKRLNKAISVYFEPSVKYNYYISNRQGVVEMAIWISRYSNKELQKDGKYYPVGISIGVPKFPLGYTVREQCYSLAPKGYMLNMELEKFIPAYYGKLADIGDQRIIDMVMRLDSKARAEGKELVLLCYEDVRIPEDWCHRTVFAQWWAEKVGEVIEELPDPNPPKVKKPVKAKEDNKKPAEKAQKPDNSYQQMDLFGMFGMAGN